MQAAKIEEKTIQDLLQLDHFKDRLTRHETRLASNEPLSDQDMQDIRTHLKNLPDAVKTILACPPPAHTGPTMASEYTNSPFQNAPSMAKPFRTATTLTWNDTPIIFPWPKNLL